MSSASFEGHELPGNLPPPPSPASDPSPLDQIPATVEDIRVYREKAQKFLDRYSRTGFFASFAGDTALRFKLGDAFYINFETGEVNLAAQWFHEKGFSERQVLWACMHEIAHFEDFKDDPERLMKNFEYIADQARGTGEGMLRKWKNALDLTDPQQKAFFDSISQESPVNPGRPEMGSFNRLAQSAYQIHHGFFNSMDDIFVNTAVSRKAASFEKGTQGGKEIEALYREKLFPSHDYSTGESRHRQFINKLLRDDNVLDEQCIVSDEVAEALERRIKFSGKTYTPKQLIDTFIKPRVGRNTKAGDRYALLKKTLEPIFQELLAKDIDEWKPEWKPPEDQPKDQSKQEQNQQTQTEPHDSPHTQPGKSDTSFDQPPTPFEGEINDWAENNIDQLPPETLKDIFEQFQDVKEEKKREEEVRKAEREKQQKEQAVRDKKSPEERVRDAQRIQDEKWAERNASRAHSKEVLLKSLELSRKVQAEIAPYLDELSQLWRHIIFGKSRETRRSTEGHFKSGSELDIQKAVDEWGDIHEGRYEKARIFNRVGTKEIVTEKPELIRVRLVGDMSGSMSPAVSGNRNKLNVLQQAMTLVFASLEEFNTYLNATRSETKSKLRAETEGWVFSNSARNIKSLNDRENAQMVSIFSYLQHPSGDTYDNTAFKAIQNSILPEDEYRIKSGKIIDIVLEITDGGSSNQYRTRSVVDELIKKGLVIRSFQIGKVSASELRIFNDIWNHDPEHQRGEHVGTDVAQLIPAITKALKQYLGHVTL